MGKSSQNIIWCRYNNSTANNPTHRIPNWRMCHINPTTANDICWDINDKHNHSDKCRARIRNGPSPWWCLGSTTIIKKIYLIPKFHIFSESQCWKQHSAISWRLSHRHFSAKKISETLRCKVKKIFKSGGSTKTIRDHIEKTNLTNDHAIIMIGSNDLYRRPHEIISNFESLINNTLQKAKSVTICGIPPRDENKDMIAKTQEININLHNVIKDRKTKKCHS